MTMRSGNCVYRNVRSDNENGAQGADAVLEPLASDGSGQSSAFVTGRS
jgi:hypothetical protein